MDFTASPPEIISGLIYSGPGSWPMLAAATAWAELATELQLAAAGHASVIAELTSGPWLGPASVSMAAASTEYVGWLRVTAAGAERAHSQAKSAAAAYETAHAMIVPPPAIAANRALLMALIATDFLGMNAPAITATEAQYAAMWAQDAAAMIEYAASSAAAAKLTPFTLPPTTHPVERAGHVMSAGSRVIAAVPQALQQVHPTPPDWMHELLALLAGMDIVQSVAGTILGASRSAVGAMTGLATNPVSQLASAGSTFAPGTAGFGFAAGAAGSGAAAVPPAVSVSATMGRAPAIGKLSVPPSWAAAAPPQSAGIGALAGSRPFGASTIIEEAPGMPGMPLAAGPARSGGGPAQRYGIPVTMPIHAAAAG